MLVDGRYMIPYKESVLEDQLMEADSINASKELHISVNRKKICRIFYKLN